MFSAKKVLTVVLLSGILLAYSGCAKAATQPDDFDAKDGNAGFMATEINDMGNASLGKLELTSPKAVVADAETLNIEMIRQAWRPGPDSAYWVRYAQITYPSGTRDRYDTAWFFNAGQPVKSPRLANADSVYHRRYVVRNQNGNVVTHAAEMTIKLTQAPGDTHAVKNGTIAGAFNGYQYRTCTVSELHRSRTGGQWNRYPSSGTIIIERDAVSAKRSRTITIAFNGTNMAAAEIKRGDGKIVNITVNLDDASEN